MCFWLLNNKGGWGRPFRKLGTWSRNSVLRVRGHAFPLPFRITLHLYRSWVNARCISGSFKVLLRWIHDLERGKIFQHRLFRQLLNGDNAQWLCTIHIRMHRHHV